MYGLRLGVQIRGGVAVLVNVPCQRLLRTEFDGGLRFGKLSSSIPFSCHPYEVQLTIASPSLLFRIRRSFAIKQFSQPSTSTRQLVRNIQDALNRHTRRLQWETLRAAWATATIVNRGYLC